MDMISYYESATHLDVSCNKSMGVSGWQALSRLLIEVRKGHIWISDNIEYRVGMLWPEKWTKQMLQLQQMRLMAFCARF